MMLSRRKNKTVRQFIL